MITARVQAAHPGPSPPPAPNPTYYLVTALLVVILVLQPDVGSHPRMNAALKVLQLVSAQLGRVRPAWCNEIVGLERGALGCWRRVPGECIEDRDNAAAEFGDACEGVYLSAFVDRKHVIALLDLDVLR